MFQANAYVDVWRDTAFSEDYSEYSEEPVVKHSLVYRKMPIHITPYRPVTTASSREEWQATQVLMNTRRNYLLSEEMK